MKPNMSTEPEQTPFNETPPPPAGPGPAAPGPIPGAEKKIVSGILAILLGWLGIHKFYLGYTVEGVIMLVLGVAGFLLCGIPTLVVSIIGVVEGVMYLTKTDEQFVATYITGRKPWF
jgi:TM2 domain-containing membrane protein YozV